MNMAPSHFLNSKHNIKLQFKKKKKKTEWYWHLKKSRSMEQKHIPGINPHIDLQNGFTVKINLFTKKE